MDTFQIGVSLLAFIATLSIGGGIVLYMNNQKRAISGRLRGANHEAYPETDTAGRSGLLEMVSGVGAAAAPKGTSSKLRMELSKAGFRGSTAPQIFLGLKFVLLLVALLALAALVEFADFSVNSKVILGLAIVGTAFFLPNMAIEFLIKQRTAEMRRALPDVVDLLEVCVSGGMGLDQAWNAVADQMITVSPNLSDEMALTNLEIHLGEDRGTAIRNMARRTGLEDLGSLVAVLVQSQRFGTSIAEALVIFATSLRETRSLRAEEAAEQMAVKMMFPMVVFIFPVELIVAIGPACITLVRVFSE